MPNCVHVCVSRWVVIIINLGCEVTNQSILPRLICSKNNLRSERKHKNDAKRKHKVTKLALD